MNKLSVNHLCGYGLEVPDLKVASDFYTAFGLSASIAEDRLLMHSAYEGPAELIAIQGLEKRLHHLSFGIHASDMSKFEEHLKKIGSPATASPQKGLREGLWFQDPWGTWINLAPTTVIQDISQNLKVPRVDRHLWRELPKEIKPNRLGHMLMFTQDWEKVEAYYCLALGLKVSDRAAGKVSFMAGGSGVRDHHCFGLINSTHRGFQHSSFQVNSVDEIGLGAMQMQKAGFTDGFGIGRHALASNLFYYTRDPWGSWIEYYADMDKISDSWQAKDWNELPYVWPQWAPEFWGKEMNANHERK